MRYLTPHAIILLGILGLISGRWSEELSLVLIGLGHLLVPIWSAKLAEPKTQLRAVLIGPGLVIAAHLVGIVGSWLALIGGHPEDRWLSFMMLAVWTVAVIAYAVYCAIAFAIVTRVRR